MSAVVRALEIFSQAVECDAATREAYLDAACGDDAALRTQVEHMLHADACDGAFLEQPLIAAESDRRGERVGAYRLDALIGSGGMGSVYRAARADGAFDKPVAIKLLAFDVGDLRARFAREQRILGHLNHPNIATLLDVGKDARGAPFLVMEFIDGLPITDYAREHALDVRAKIALFLPILDAAQSAHSQLIVHRDIKPGNVLVDAQGVVKLLDFGIAKLLGDNLVGAAATRTGLGPLTPEYASPEQVRGAPVGTPSDIYSLGMLLYELVTGARAYSIGDTSPSGIERTVCDTEPLRPSTRFARGKRSGSARDLDAILLKALAKSPMQRYASCAEFSADLRRWLHGESVVAREPMAHERLLRYVRRHRFGVSVAAAASLALLAGLAVALWQAQLAREHARIANVERDRARRANKFLTDTLGAANPSDMGRKATVLDVLARARKLADKELTGDPETAATTQLVLSQTYRALADFTTARDCAIAALQAAERGGDPVLAIDARHDLAAAQFNLGDLKSAAQNATAARTAALAQGTAQQRGNTAVLLGQLASENGDTQAAFDWFDHALVELPPDDVKNRAAALNNYGVALHVKGDDVAALAKYREAIALAAGAHMDSDPVAITQYGNFAAALRANGKLDEAVDVLTGKVLPKQIELLGENSADVVWTLSNLATIEYERKNPAAMLDYAQRGYLAAEHLADADEWKALGFKKYGLSLIRAHRAQEAVPILERALALSRQGLPEGHYDIGSLESWLGLARSMTGDRTGGEALARGAYARLLAKYGEKNESTRIAKKNLDAIAALPVP